MLMKMELSSFNCIGFRDSFLSLLFNSISNKFTSKAVEFFQYSFFFPEKYFIFCLLKVILNRIYLDIIEEIKSNKQI